MGVWVLGTMCLRKLIAKCPWIGHGFTFTLRGGFTLHGKKYTEGFFSAVIMVNYLEFYDLLTGYTNGYVFYVFRGRWFRTASVTWRSSDKAEFIHETWMDT